MWPFLQYQFSSCKQWFDIDVGWICRWKGEERKKTHLWDNRMSYNPLVFSLQILAIKCDYYHSSKNLILDIDILVNLTVTSCRCFFQFNISKGLHSRFFLVESSILFVSNYSYERMIINSIDYANNVLFS